MDAKQRRLDKRQKELLNTGIHASAQVHAAETKISMIADELKGTRGRLDAARMCIEELESEQDEAKASVEEMMYGSHKVISNLEARLKVSEGEVTDLLLAIGDKNQTLLDQGNKIITLQVETDNLKHQVDRLREEDHDAAKLRRRKRELQAEVDLSNQRIKALESKLSAYETHTTASSLTSPSVERNSMDVIVGRVYSHMKGYR